MQLLEIDNGQLRDLLGEQRSGRRLDIRNTERSGLNVPDAIQVAACLACIKPFVPLAAGASKNHQGGAGKWACNRRNSLA